MTTINGVIYTVGTHPGTKYSRENDIKSDKWFTLKPNEIATYLGLDNQSLVSRFVVRQIELDPSNKGMMPQVLNISEVDNWPVKASTNGIYANFWMGVTFFNVFTNMFVWLYL